MEIYSDVGCPALDRRALHCHTACRDARMTGESRLCEGSEYDPYQADMAKLMEREFELTDKP